MTELEIAEPPIPLHPVEIKALVRHRDGYCCVDCGISAAEHLEIHGRNLDGHRLSPGSPYTVAGTIAVCRSCHRKRHGLAPEGGNKREPRESFHLPKPLRDALTAYINRTKPKPGKSEVLRLALEEYLQRQGAGTGHAP